MLNANATALPATTLDRYEMETGNSTRRTVLPLKYGWAVANVQRSYPGADDLNTNIRFLVALDSTSLIKIPRRGQLLEKNGKTHLFGDNFLNFLHVAEFSFFGQVGHGGTNLDGALEGRLLLFTLSRWSASWWWWSAARPLPKPLPSKHGVLA